MAIEDHFRSLGDESLETRSSLSATFAPQPVPSTLRGAMVRIVADNRAGRGFIVDAKGRIVTELPLVEDAARIKVSTADGDVFLAHIIHKDAKRGLVLLEIPERTPGELTLGEVSGADVGEDVLLVAKQGGDSVELGKGVMTALRRINGVSVIQFEASGELGAGGTPILSSKGNVIGICSSRFEKTRDNVGFAISSNELKALLYAEWATFDIEKVFKKADV